MQSFAQAGLSPSLLLLFPPPPFFKSEANKCLVFKDFYFFHYLQLIYSVLQLLYSKVSQSYICIHVYMTIYVLLYILYL